MTIRTSLVDLINSLDAILRNAEMTDTQRERMLRLRALLSAMLDEVLRQEINKDTAAYQKAIDRTLEATKVADQALKDLKTIAEVIQKAAQAAKAIDQVIKFAASVLA
jgi:hypothetical protein